MSEKAVVMKNEILADVEEGAADSTCDMPLDGVSSLSSALPLVFFSSFSDRLLLNYP